MQDDATQVECIGHVSLSHYEPRRGSRIPVLMTSKYLSDSELGSLARHLSHLNPQLFGVALFQGHVSCRIGRCTLQRLS